MPATNSRPALIPILIVATALIVLVVLVVIMGRDPVVELLQPSVVSAGDAVTIAGRHFGEVPATLRLGGRDLPTSGITRWSDQQIDFVVPRNSESGLLYVIHERGRSGGVMLQIRETIPRTSFTGSGPGAPAIEGIDASELLIGGVVTLRGENFGSARRGSQVIFPMEGGVACAPCAESVSYANWSDSRIVVRVPSGAASGFVSVVTDWGVSNSVRIAVQRPAGSVIAERPAEIAVRYGARVSEVILSDGDGPLSGERDLVVRLPALSESEAQRSLRHLDESTNQVRFELVDAAFDREITRTAIVHRYALRSAIDSARLSAAYEAETGFFEYYTRPLPGVPVDDPEIQAIAVRLRSNRGSPLRIAEAAYAFTVDSLVFALGMADRSVLAGLSQGAGDDCTYALLFVTVLRAARVPARAVGGVLVTEDGHAYPHFWAEFFVTGVGWIPVDPALGDGAFPAGFPVPADPRAFYFGNLDNRRIAFLHGYDGVGPTYLDGVSVEPSDPYTLQRSYAEAGRRVRSFRLNWHVPRVISLLASD